MIDTVQLWPPLDGRFGRIQMVASLAATSRSFSFCLSHLGPAKRAGLPSSVAG